uniref:UBC core domain-containing protein n=1 Tax=Oncorhynchus mykiss TaxID=8022 RepID=A0A8L0DRY9_ONCMY
MLSELYPTNCKGYLALINGIKCLKLMVISVVPISLTSSSPSTTPTPLRPSVFSPRCGIPTSTRTVTCASPSSTLPLMTPRAGSSPQRGGTPPRTSGQVESAECVFNQTSREEVASNGATWVKWTILLSVISLLNEPNTFSPANVDASVMFRKWRDSKGKDKEYAEIIRKQVVSTVAEAERDGVKVPTTLAEYCVQTRVPSQDSSSDLLYDDLYDDDMEEEEEEDEDEESDMESGGEAGGTSGGEGGVTTGCYDDDQEDSGNEDS